MNDIFHVVAELEGGFLPLLSVQEAADCTREREVIEMLWKMAEHMSGTGLYVVLPVATIDQVGMSATSPTLAVQILADRLTARASITAHSYH